MNPGIQNKNILISGASIAGPALAWWLNKYDFNVTIVEKAPALREGGYRVDIRGAAADIVERMGLMSDIRKVGTALKGSSLVNKKGKTILELDDPNIFGMRQENDAEIMRGNLANILYQATHHNTEYIFNDSITGIFQTGKDVTVTFKNAAPRNFDLVVGADGLHSNVRNIAFGGDHSFVKDLDYYVSICTIPNYFKLDHWEISYPSAGKLINVYSTHRQQEAKAFFMFASPPIKYNYHDIAQQKNILVTHFRDAGWETEKLMQQMHSADDFYFDSVSQVHMDSLSKSRVVLLGDAGYCPSPASGQGTSMALVGAYVLAGELAAANSDHFTAFLKYEWEMKGFIRKNQQLGLSVLKEMIPKSKMQVWFQNTMLRLLTHSPWKNRVLKGILGKIQSDVEDAANAIELKDYAQAEALYSN
ncbi:FAD-dependent monooxygenase [Mucilaginibacter sp. X5P1]|uniref:FAD-dependent monooxygenase n=1 Tax=Mucilaginibacter sp. X5P1 TaxID=2723088 RepID=UPI0016220AF5|nr:FAD-dependent monooxygenase [Mucilaginibacter sp. X5P1]MBB6140271.1 2-polyprenyl-6-methoxyphenol hydroxylase-like FAD-dependent oxidoreductase [Mucilaginibacter sp. X5P1]